jgi:complement component 1 Q subcomponent-binding protein, mitochondrial
MKREHKNESIEIIFDCQDEADPDEEEEEPEENEDDEGSDAEAQDTAVGAGINFKAIITKPSGEKVVIQCAAFENIKVDGVRYIAADKEVKDTTLYSGPVFDYLDDELQDAFYSYLSDRKIDDDLAHFITSYAVEKEQNEYAIWLRQLAAFTSE